MTLFAAAIGWILASFVATFDLGDFADLISAIFWFLIAFSTHFFAKRIKDEKRFGLLSLNFFITWAFCTAGAIIGDIVWDLIDSESTSIQLDAVVDSFFFFLALTIGPTATAALGIRES
jgi:hypothetical protein